MIGLAKWSGLVPDLREQQRVTFHLERQHIESAGLHQGRRLRDQNTLCTFIPLKFICPGLRVEGSPRGPQLVGACFYSAALRQRGSRLVGGHVDIREGFPVA